MARILKDLGAALGTAAMVCVVLVAAPVNLPLLFIGVAFLVFAILRIVPPWWARDGVGR
jgi:hypothetical protein